MDQIKKFHYIKTFLIETQKMWDEEIIFSYPECFNFFPREWVLELMLAPQEKLYRFASFGEDEFIVNKKFKDFLLEIKTLSEVPYANKEKKEEELKIPFLKIKGKKEHEIKSIFNFLKDKNNFNLIIDHCGGKGNLSQSLHQYCNSSNNQPDFVCIDFNDELLTMGKKKYSENNNSVFYSKKDLFKSAPPYYLKGVPDTLSLGLHTCGGLAVKQIEWAKYLEVPYFLNFGCCYSRLYDDGGLNLSQKAQDKKFGELYFGQAGLTLAAHAHHPMTLKDFDIKLNVKKYRYAFFLFLRQHYPNYIFETIGNSKQSLYREDFATYANNQLIKLGIEVVKPERLNQFYNSSQLQEEIMTMIVMGIIRGNLGRLVEIYILMDRVFYLEESSYKAQLLTFFEPSLSPRNIGLWAIKN